MKNFIIFCYAKCASHPFISEIIGVHYQFIALWDYLPAVLQHLTNILGTNIILKETVTIMGVINNAYFCQNNSGFLQNSRNLRLKYRWKIICSHLWPKFISSKKNQLVDSNFPIYSFSVKSKNMEILIQYEFFLL